MRRLSGIFQIVLGAAGVLAVAGLVMVMILPFQFNFRYVAVLSGSMTPIMPVGSVGVVQPVPAEKIGLGDVLTFTSKDHSGNLVTHRVVEILTGEDGALSFRTKGDANEGNDRSLVPTEAVEGRVIMVVPGAGLLNNFMDDHNQLWLVFPMLGVLVILNEAWSYRRSQDPRRKAIQRRRQLRAK